MAINTQKFLPGSGSSAIVKSAVKTSAISKSLQRSSSSIIKAEDVIRKPEGAKENDATLSIYKKTIQIDKLLKNNLKLQSKEEEQRSKETEVKKREKKEKELETPKKFKGFQILKNALPKTGILDSIKRFIIFTFAGWVFTRLFQFLPRLLDIVKLIAPVYSWFEKGIGMLLEGFVSFIDFGYKAYDGVRDLTKQIGGENFQKVFDDFSSNLNKFLNLTITAAMIAAASGGFGGRGGRIAGRPKVIPRGKPRVTTTGGRAAGRPGLRSPFRQRPQVTTSGGKPVGGFKIPKGAGALTKGARGIIGIGTILDIGVRLASGQPVSKAVVGAAGGAIGAGIGTWLGGTIGGVAGSVVPIIGNLLLGGAGATIGGILGGMLGGGIADALYDVVTGYGKQTDIQKKDNGGLVQRKTSRISPRRRTRIQAPIQKISTKKIQPGKDVGGKKKIEKLYPNPESKLFGFIPVPGDFSWLDFIFGGNQRDKKKAKPGNIPNALKALVNTGETLGKSGDWVGALMKAGIQVALGEIPDVKSIASAITQVVMSARTPAMEGINAIRKEIQGFADGGLVATNSSYYQNNTILLERALEGTIKKRVDDALNSVRKEVRKRGPTGRDEMLQRNRQRPGTEKPPATAPSAGESAGASISKISMGDLSEQDIDALGRMIAAESQNQPKIGKAGVLSVILNRYRLAKAGKGYLPAGKTKDNVTIRDILYAPNQFSPITDGRFDRTSSSAGRKALEDAISGGGNDPKKLKELLIKEMKLKESDAETVVRATAFSNPKTRGSRPFNTPEVAVGDHSFQESPNVRIKDFPGAIKADVKKEVPQYSGNLTNKFLKNLDIKLPGLTLGGQKYRAPRDGGAREHAGRDYDLPHDGVFNSRLGGVVIFAGNVGGGYGNVVDIYNKDLNRTERIAEGTTILSGIEKGAVISPGQPVVQGTHQTGVIHYEIRKGKAGPSGSVEGTEDPDAFLNSADYKDYISKVASGETKQKTELKLGSVLKSTKIGEGYVLTIRQGENNQKDYFLNGKKLSPTEVATYQKNHPSAFQVSEQKKESWIDKLNPTRIFKSTSSPSKIQVAGGGMGGKRGSGSSPTGMQGGGFISPSKSSVPNVASRAYYENPTGSSLIAVLPIETVQKVPVPVGAGVLDSFPVAGLNNSNSSYGLMRG